MRLSAVLACLLVLAACGVELDPDDPDYPTDEPIMQPLSADDLDDLEARLATPPPDLDRARSLFGGLGADQDLGLGIDAGALPLEAIDEDAYLDDADGLDPFAPNGIEEDDPFKPIGEEFYERDGY